jgi:hypothetical protein
MQKAHVGWLLQVVASWLKQYLPFKLLSDSSVALLAEVRAVGSLGVATQCVGVDMQLQQRWQQLQQK